MFFALTMLLSTPPQELSWQAREVVRVLDDRPHLLVRVEIHGGYFPDRSAEPFVRIASGKGEGEGIESWFAEVAPDNGALYGYFPVELPARGRLEFGYGARVWGRIPEGYTPERVERLDRKQLPEDIVVVTPEELRRNR